ncbi:hypothetical protein ABZT47_11360 [Sphaerisporangium sp. NPDC005289]|uniref:hypothetical protein n=1 Tax=Sphaerisporangium sp. NPDC005289 TaxID=3155247 RepID=UPI0033B3BAAF
MNDLGGEVRRLCVAVDAEQDGGRSGVRHGETRRRLAEVIEEAAAHAGLDRLYIADPLPAPPSAEQGTADLALPDPSGLEHGTAGHVPLDSSGVARHPASGVAYGIGGSAPPEPSGFDEGTGGRNATASPRAEDGVSGPVGSGAVAGAGAGPLLILPPGVNEARVIAGLTGELRIALRRRNERAGTGASARLRLRVAFHQGSISIGDDGFAGRAAATARALRDSDEVRAALRQRPGADLAVAVSAPLFEDVIEHAHRGLVRHMFHPVTLRSVDAGTRVWISAPDALHTLYGGHPVELPLTAG